MRHAGSPPDPPEKPDLSIVETIETIVGQFELLISRPEHVAEPCRKLSRQLKQEPAGFDPQTLAPLLPLLQKRSGPAAAHLFELLREVAIASDAPRDFLQSMISARDSALVEKAMDLTSELLKTGRMKIDEAFLLFLAERMKLENSFLARPEAMGPLSEWLQDLDARNGSDPGDAVHKLYTCSEKIELQSLAARILDHSEETVGLRSATRILGEESLEFFMPLLAYTQASHVDLLHLKLGSERLRSLEEELRAAQEIIGHDLLLEIIAATGWNRLNLGLKVQALHPLSVGDSAPYMLEELEADLLEEIPGARRSEEIFLITTCGGRPSGNPETKDEADPIARFRSYNLIHASLLGDFLDVGPLDEKKVLGMIERMDSIVEDYVRLFSSFSDECTILEDIYRELKKRILDELWNSPDEAQFSPELTRLVQSFEEPRNIGEVRTLHGLKRYLHQTGLAMGFRFVEGARSPNRTVDLLLATPRGIRFSLGKIHYADFESPPEGEDAEENIPFSVHLLIDGFSRQILHGREQFPHADIFCYGNEVHYYFGFRNHPIFLRIDFAPPLRGGMIDLEYFGVSNYELDRHPDLSLEAIRSFFLGMEFDITLEGTRIHARYDKERALNLGDLCEKAGQLFRLAPYLMDLDWTIGSLVLEIDQRKKVVAAWADFFLRWGFLPLKTILSKDRSSILTGFVDEPTGRRESTWTGGGEYRDLHSGLPGPDFTGQLAELIHRLGMEIVLSARIASSAHPGQLELEAILLRPMREATARGELISTAAGLVLQAADRFRRSHEAEYFAELLAEGQDAVAEAVATARLVRPLERSITFHTTGSINGYPVQKATLSLRTEEICFFVLRGSDEMIRLAFFTRDRVLFSRREKDDRPWISNACRQPRQLAGLLRANDFLDTTREGGAAGDLEEAIVFQAEIEQSRLPLELAPLPGERIVAGLKASPGRCVGRALLGTGGRKVSDFTGSILVSPTIQPEDTPFLHTTGGIISTGGGILSHAGLIAMQLGKPALIIEGRWDTDAAGESILYIRCLEYRIQHQRRCGFTVSIRSEIQEKESVLREGDLLLLDVLKGDLRVLGQQRDILALHEAFRMYESANDALSKIRDEREILGLRGKRLRGRHLVENVLRRCTDPATARYAIFEILLDESARRAAMFHLDKSILLQVLLDNAKLGAGIREDLMRTLTDLQASLEETTRRAMARIPGSTFLHEILALRLDVIHHRLAVVSATEALKGCGLECPPAGYDSQEDLDTLVNDRLSTLGSELRLRIQQIDDGEPFDARSPHFLRQLARIEGILSHKHEIEPWIGQLSERIARENSRRIVALFDRRVIQQSDGGFELFEHIGWKAANLAEIQRLAGEQIVPPWFVVTDAAFREMLAAPAGNRSGENESLQEAIDLILRREDLDAKQKSRQIRGLWQRAALPAGLAEAVLGAYRGIIGKPDAESSDQVHVAVRSSSQEEDTEAASHAGEFETYLYIQGEDSLLDHLKLTWSGLWTERAIHSRAMAGPRVGHAGGGIIVQRMVDSRVAGVLQTVNIPRGNLREMVINAGLGLGEGVVSGTVAADQITVLKEIDPEKQALRFNYITSDKTEQVVFNRRAGQGTIRSQTLYHQRLRPALEYVELCQLVEIASTLEKAYGYPLDIEFGIEKDQLWILQARPVPSSVAILNETIEHFPLARVAERDSSSNSKRGRR